MGARWRSSAWASAYVAISAIMSWCHAFCRGPVLASHEATAKTRRLATSMATAEPCTTLSDASRAVETRVWKWRDYDIRYKVAGEGTDGPPMVLVHGFGGNADHWRKSMSTLSGTGPAYAIDLLGYGYSSKPDPGPWMDRNQIYSFEMWGQQLLDFVDEVVGRKAFLVCNSVGGVAGLQAAVVAPEKVYGVVLFNISLRMLHTSKQSALSRPLVKGLQWVLRETPIGPAFFGSVAKVCSRTMVRSRHSLLRSFHAKRLYQSPSKAVSNILKQCYGDPLQVTDELVEFILTPGLEPGAVKVFLDFISYSGGPLPEELLKDVQVPVLIGWGEKDPWEPIAMGRELAAFDSVEDFVVIPGAGHCPQDEVPHLTDSIITTFVTKHYA